MDNSERPEKKRKLDEDNDASGSRVNQPRPITLGERKRNGPRVLVNKLNLNNEIIDRLRRITKLWGKQTVIQKNNCQGNETGEVNGLKDAENAPARVGTNETGNVTELKDGVLKEARSSELELKDSRQGVTTFPNDAKGIKTYSVDSGKSKDDDRAMEQSVEDVLIFKQVLKEVIEQRTKIVEEAVAANSIHLQNRIRDLERENRELQWSTRKLFGAFKKYVSENEKKSKLTKTSCGIQVNIESNFESRVISAPRNRDTLVIKSPVSGSGERMSRRESTLTSDVSSNVTNITTASTVVAQQSSAQLRPNPTSHAQQPSSNASEATAVVFTVTPWQTGPETSQQKLTEKEGRCLEIRTAQMTPAVRDNYSKNQPLLWTKSPPSVASQIHSSAQTNTNLDRVNNRPQDIAQRSLLEQQLGLPGISKPPAQQQHIIPSQATASLLQRLQLQHQRYKQMQSLQQSAQSSSSLRQPDRSHAQSQQVQRVAQGPTGPPSLASTSARNPNNGHQTAISYFTTSKQLSLSNQSNQQSIQVTSNTKVYEHVNQPVSHLCGNPPSSSDFLNNSAHVCETLERKTTIPTVKVAVNDNHQKESTVTPNYLSQNHTQPRTAATRREIPQLPKETSSATTSTYSKFQPDVQSMQKTSTLVRARKRHSEQNGFLPPGYRLSLPSPEYLLQQQKLQREQQILLSESPPHFPRASQVSQMQPLPSRSASKRGGTFNQPPQVAYTRETQSVQTLNEAATRSVYQPIPPVSENRSYRPHHQGGHLQHGKQPQQTQPPTGLLKPKEVQGKHQESLLTREDLNCSVTLQSVHRPPIQSPGISSSDPRNEKHSKDAQTTAIANSTSSSHPTNVLEQGILEKSMPKPSASIAVMGSGIVLSWNMEYNEADIKIDNYELFACQDITETNGQPIKWKKIGIVKALPLPMACTLTQFSSGTKYFFSVRAVDEDERAGPFSDPCTVSLNSS